MSGIFEQGAFNKYSDIFLSTSKSTIYEFSKSGEMVTTVFISHKHDDLNDLKGVIGFLEKTHNIKAYIDSRDPSMPPITSSLTATTLKERIKKCNKFILLAKNAAIESKWCNGELGFGDAHKYKKNIALFPMKPSGTYDYEYKGSEYLRIYPYIKYSDGTEYYSDGSRISQGYYVVSPESGNNYYTSLDTWFQNR